MVKSLRGEVEVSLAGVTYTARLGIGELEEIENATGLGTLELLKSFGTNAKIRNTIAVLSQALTENDKRIGHARARRIVEKAGFGESVTACITALSAVLIEPTEGNADAVEAEAKAPTA
jgi:hypothetical protein